MKRAHEHREYRNVSEFEAPAGVVSVQIDPASGQLATAACPKVRTEYFIEGHAAGGDVPTARRRRNAGGQLGDGARGASGARPIGRGGEPAAGTGGARRAAAGSGAGAGEPS